MDAESGTRAAIEEHWRASERGEIEAEHAIYADDAVLDYPQSGERFRGRSTIAAQRGGHPADRHFTVLRIVGSGDLWVSECVITYDGVPTFSVSVMEFTDEHVVHETQYFADTFSAPPSRAALAEPMPDRTAPVAVAVTTSRSEAELIVGLLHSYGLPAAVSADDAGGQEPQLQLQGVRVLVAPADETAARDVLAVCPTRRSAAGCSSAPDRGLALAEGVRQARDQLPQGAAPRDERGRVPTRSGQPSTRDL